jgi:hypothetical protein
MYNLNYTPSTLEVQSWRQIASGGKKTKKKNKKKLNAADVNGSVTLVSLGCICLSGGIWRKGYWTLGYTEDKHFDQPRDHQPRKGLWSVELI